MEQFEIVTSVGVLSYDELSEQDALLVEAAREMTFKSYSPYSQFKVGAAILLANGEIVTGSNQENVAFPSGTCAERTACFYAHAQYPEAKFCKIAIAARGTDDEFTSEPTPPCGACRQVLLEYEQLAGRDVPVYLAGRDKVYVLPSVKSLMPLSFTEF